ncbi:MAG: sulfite exporter TauE/SafE family protein [Burkholderiaceae bacterium]|nr:sulfite exporter TauE/SafE family protein [Burkholderiaceae bacterium]MCZ8111234.1 sulfite exporter TauE/SafE family protein [Rubrivivax sp.]MCZ8173788.1 sulfite exporter TauE/SafE family protein [Burkholderiaceae bacterium]
MTTSGPAGLDAALMELLALAGLGAVAGLLMALTGAGGGALGVPLLVLLLHLPMQQASAMSLVAVGLAGALGALLGLRDRLLRYRAALMLGAAGMLAAPLGVALAQRLAQPVLLVVFAGFMLFTAWRMWRSADPDPDAAPAAQRPAQPACMRPDGELRLRWTPRCAWVLGRVGALAGVLSGLLGIGGGFVIVPALDRHTNLDLRSIQVTSLGVIALVALAGVAAAAAHGQLALQGAMPFAAGCVAGLLLGRRLAPRISVPRLRRGFAVLAVLVALLVLARALRG